MVRVRWGAGTEGYSREEGALPGSSEPQHGVVGCIPGRVQVDKGCSCMEGLSQWYV